MTQRISRNDLQVDEVLHRFIEEQALPGTDVLPENFWKGFSDLVHTMGPRNRALLEKREALQAKIDDWHIQKRGAPHDHRAYKAFLEEIGYLLPEGRISRLTPPMSILKSLTFPARNLWCQSPMRALP